VDLEKGFPEAIQLTLDNWTHIQPVDYEQLHSNVSSAMNMGIFLNIVQKYCPK
jgi:hypothetical protein